jgi:hypothetical protein
MSSAMRSSARTSLSLRKERRRDESEDKDKCRDTGDPKGSEDLQDIKEMFNETKKPTE